MEQYLQMDEVIRRAMARLGFTTNASQAVLVKQELEELARAAHLEVFAAHEWGNLKAEERVSIGIDQTVIDYPDDTTAGDLIAVSVWDGSRYIPLCERFIPASMTQDPLVDEGEPASVSNRGIPRFFEKRGQISIAPRPDKAYEVKLLFTTGADLPSGTSVTKVDAELCILHMIRAKRLSMGDTEMAMLAGEQYDSRMLVLRRRSSSGQAVQRNAGYRDRVNARQASTGYEPNSGTWPSVMPSA